MEKDFKINFTKELSEEHKISILQKSINDGIESGRSESFDPKQHLIKLKLNKKKRLTN